MVHKACSLVHRPCSMDFLNGSDNPRSIWPIKLSKASKLYLNNVKVNVSKVNVKIKVNKGNVKVNVNKVTDIYSIHSHYKGGGRWPPPQESCRGFIYVRGTSSVVSFVVAMNRVDVVDLVDVVPF